MLKVTSPATVTNPSHIDALLYSYKRPLTIVLYLLEVKPRAPVSASVKGTKIVMYLSGVDNLELKFNKGP